MTDDGERLEHYLEWRRTFDRERATRRRKVLASAAIVGVIVVGVGLAGWLARRPTPARVATVRPLGTAPPEVRPPAVERPVRRQSGA